MCWFVLALCALQLIGKKKPIATWFTRLLSRAWHWSYVSLRLALAVGFPLCTGCRWYVFPRLAAAALFWLVCCDFGHLWLPVSGFRLVVVYNNVTTSSNHKGLRQFTKPIKARSKHVQPTQSAGKCLWASHDWFWFYFWLVEKGAWLFSTNHLACLCKAKANANYFPLSIQVKSALVSLYIFIHFRWPMELQQLSLAGPRSSSPFHSLYDSGTWQSVVWLS